jgi:lysine/ornithine N-monooxygenase
MRKSRILVCQGFNDNSTAVEVLEEAAAVFNQKKHKNCWITSMFCVALTRAEEQLYVMNMNLSSKGISEE